MVVLLIQELVAQVCPAFEADFPVILQAQVILLALQPGLAQVRALAWVAVWALVRGPAALLVRPREEVAAAVQPPACGYPSPRWRGLAQRTLKAMAGPAARPHAPPVPRR